MIFACSLSNRFFLPDDSRASAIKGNYVSGMILARSIHTRNISLQTPCFATVDITQMIPINTTRNQIEVAVTLIT
jgi:hypothetical protein